MLSPTPSPQSIPGTLHSLSPLATVSPDSSWYRRSPNTYQNTTVITIDRARTNITLRFPNGTMTVNNATRTSFEAITNYSQSYVLINNTLPEMANKNISFKVDGVNYANSTADSKGFVSIDYSGTWSKHTFEWVLIPDGNRNIADQVQVALHFGEATSPPYPSYDPDEDGIVSILDAVLIAKEII